MSNDDRITHLTADGDRVDSIVMHYFGTDRGGLVEQTYALNPGLAALGAVLPRGVVVRLPVANITTKPVKTIRLWD